MNSIITKIRDKHSLWFKGIVFVFCVIICTYLLPKQSSWLSTNIKQGDIWLNDNLISSIDFLIHKSPDELVKETSKNRVKIMYFKKVSVHSHALIPESSLILIPDSQIVKRCLDSLYSVGVYFSQKEKTFQDSLMYVVNENEVTLATKTSFFDKEKAKLFLLNYISNVEVINDVIKHLVPNIVYDESLSNEIALNEASESQIYKSKIKKGDVLAYKNDVITSQQVAVLNSYTQELKEQEKENSDTLRLLGQFLTCLLILSIMMLFLAFFRKSIFSQNTHVTFIFLIIVLVVLFSNLVSKYNHNYFYAVPFCLVPILIRVFFDSRTALFSFLNIVLLCAFFTNDKFGFVFIQLTAGIGTIFSVANIGQRSKLFISAVLTFTFYILSFIAYHLINGTSQALEHSYNYIPFVISSLCVLFSFPLIYLFEKVFGFVSDFTLLELCDLNSPLLRNLSQKIPGTFQHSLQVANLAEEACYKIGGNALLVRTGAMYHDIGKINNPRFFTENQVGEVSPHADLSPQESAQIIIGHVIKGIEIAKENKLPESVIDFIRTHHGTTTTRFFLNNYKKKHEGETVNENLFRYLGPIPFSKETAVLMMADSVEAASRSLKKHDALTIDELVDKIINYQINENQFVNSDITFRDINQIKKIFKKRLMSIYHVRIEYPR